MTTPVNYDFTWVRGTTAPLRLSFMLNNLPIPYDDIRLTVFNRSGLAFRLSSLNDAGIGPGKVQTVSPGVLDFMPTATQTRSLTETPNDGTPGKNRYEVEVRNGTEEDVYVLGVIAGVGGINDDEA